MSFVGRLLIRSLGQTVCTLAKNNVSATITKVYTLADKYCYAEITSIVEKLDYLLLVHTCKEFMEAEFLFVS